MAAVQAVQAGAAQVAPVVVDRAVQEAVDQVVLAVRAAPVVVVVAADGVMVSDSGRMRTARA